MSKDRVCLFIIIIVIIILKISISFVSPSFIVQLLSTSRNVVSRLILILDVHVAHIMWLEFQLHYCSFTHKASPSHSGPLTIFFAEQMRVWNFIALSL